MAEISFGNDSMSEIWFGRNRIYPSTSVLEYSLINVRAVYSDGISQLRPSQSNYVTLQGTIQTKQDGTVISTRDVTLTPIISSMSSSLGEYFTIVSDKIYYNKSEFGKTNLYSTFGNTYTTIWEGIFGELSASTSIVTYSNRPETTLTTNQVKCNITNTEDIPALGGNLNITIGRYTNVDTTYSSGLIDRVQTPISMLPTDIYTGETPDINYMNYVGNTSNSTYSIPISTNPNQSIRTIYVGVCTSNNETAVNYIEQGECYMSLYSLYDGEYINFGDTYYMYGDSEFNILDEGDNTHNYFVNISGTGEDSVEWNCDGNEIWIYGITSSCQLTITITEDNCSYMRFNIVG